MDKIEQWIEGNPLRVWRRDNKVTETKLSLLIGATPGSIRNWERGANRPNANYMGKIAKVIGIPLFDSWKDWNRWWAERPSVELESEDIYAIRQGKKKRIR